MSISEKLAQLRAAVADPPLDAQQTVTDWAEMVGRRVTELLGDSHALRGELIELADHVMNLSSETFGALERLMTAVNGAADRLSGS